MISRSVSLMIAVAALLFLGTAVLAQFETTESSPVGIGVTLFRPWDDTLKKVASNWIGPSLQYHTKRDKLGRPILFASISWFYADKHLALGRVIPIGITMLKRYGQDENCWYIGGTLSASFAHYENYELDPKLGYYRRISDNSTLFGYGLTLGREFGGGWYFETKFNGATKMNRQVGGKIDFSGWSFTLGSRLAY